jgi:hypothetical protein
LLVFLPAHELDNTPIAHRSFAMAEYAELWNEGRQLVSDQKLVTLIAVITHHHTPEQAPDRRALVALVSIADLLCRMRNLGYGYAERRLVDLLEEKAFTVLVEECTTLAEFDWARLTFELDNYMLEVHKLVAALYRIQ